MALAGNHGGGWAAWWGGSAVARREMPYFQEATGRFCQPPHNFTSELSDRLTPPYRVQVRVYTCVSAIAQAISSVPTLFPKGERG